MDTSTETRDVKKWYMKKEGRDRQREKQGCTLYRNVARNGKFVEI